MLKSDWCAAVLTHARLCLLTIVRADSVITTRSVATPISHPSPWSAISSSLKSYQGNIEVDAVTNDVDMCNRENAVRGLLIEPVGRSLCRMVWYLVFAGRRELR